MLSTETIGRVKEALSELDPSKDILELCGPTPTGYMFLDKYRITLPRKPLVSNITNPITLNPYGDKPESHEVDLVVDIRSLPYADSSLAMLLVSYPPLTSDAHLSIPWRWLRRRASEVSIRLARRDGRAAKLLSKRNMHIAMLREAYRSLVAGGVFLFQGAWPEDLLVAQKLGFHVLLDDSLSGGTDTVLLQK